MDMLLKIAIWNASGLAQQSIEVQAFIQFQDIDIMLISETLKKIHQYKKLYCV